MDLVRPERDVLAIIERLRTGPFRPRPTMFVSHYSEPPLQNFGIDLRKFEETLGKDDSRMPPVLSFLLDYVTEKYETLADAGESCLFLSLTLALWSTNYVGFRLQRNASCGSTKLHSPRSITYVLQLTFLASSIRKVLRSMISLWSFPLPVRHTSSISLDVAIDQLLPRTLAARA